MYFEFTQIKIILPINIKSFSQAHEFDFTKFMMGFKTNQHELKNKGFLLIFILFLQAFAVNCSTCNCGKELPDLTDEQRAENLHKKAREMFGDNYKIESNASKEYYLVTDFIKNPTQLSINFFVYEIKSEKILLKDFIKSGSVKWTDKYLLDVQIHPGIVKINDSKDDIGYYYNVEINQRINK